MAEKLTREDVERIVREARGKGERPNLSGITLTGVNLHGSNLYQTNLSGSSLRNCDLSGSDLSYADFSEVDFTQINLGGAKLKGAKFNNGLLSWVFLRQADLSDASFIKAYLNDVDLSLTYLNRVDFSSAKFERVTFGPIDLNEIKGLKTIRHFGGSYIDSQTLRIMKGHLPIVFLRGCGLSDWEIENAKLYNPNLTEHQITDIIYKIHNLLTGPAIKYKSCFISYANQDQALAERIYTDLQESGVRCWYAPEDMKIGDKIRHSIDQAIRLQDKLLLILSENSVQSDWVGDEVEHALELEKERGQAVLFPLRVDDKVMQSKIGWAAKLKRDRHIGDFCGWPDDGAYQQGFKRLLNDLRAEG